MVYIINDFTRESLANLLKDVKNKDKRRVLVEHGFDGSLYQESDGQEWSKKSLAKYFGCLKRGIDGMEYQKAVRNEWN